MINTKKFRLLYLTPIFIGIVMFFLLGPVSNISQSTDVIVIFQHTIISLASVTLYTLVPLGLFYDLIDIKQDKDFVVLLGVLLGLTGVALISAYGILAAITPLTATLFFVVVCLLAVNLKAINLKKKKGNENFKSIFPILTIIGLALYVPGGIINKFGIEATSNLLLAYVISIALPTVFSMLLLKKK